MGCGTGEDKAAPRARSPGAGPGRAVVIAFLIHRGCIGSHGSPLDVSSLFAAGRAARPLAPSSGAPAVRTRALPGRGDRVCGSQGAVRQPDTGMDDCVP